ncbi:diaminopimelate decarboxylase [Acetivibrio sp. MSJd-27]|uniref:diaminopimelate decarboxylase n=1 Tax=Acetivibrio sp. MSJd-27 TaxID=2841523 RepID=UPI001C11FDC4|nr:diaminopimelate decarboxylase [Acetivibrio sp. MSJd-27]MBU5451183.1 diaminopimelate decarboxylase [Acetivibrio sp. MSJd-27]
MFVTENLEVNEQNHLTIGGVDTIALAEKYGTPLYVMDEDMIRQNCRIYKDAIDRDYNGNGLILYASKAFSCLHMYRIVREEGLGVDVVSGGELYTALKAGMDPEKIYFHGNNKTDDEIELAVSNNVGRLVVDNFLELEHINRIAKEKNKTVSILFRIKPGIDAHTHAFIRTGQIDSKFGFALETGEAFEAVKSASEYKNLKIAGIHCHIGSQIFELEPFQEAAKVMCGFIAEVKDKLDIVMDELNLGGGFGIKYTEKDDPVAYDQYIDAVASVIKTCCWEAGIKLPKILMEPGRSIVASAGITLYTIGNVKNIPGIRKYVSVDGGMTDNPRYILYQSEYEAAIANKASDPRDDIVTIAGKCCESGDLIQENTKLQQAEAGDVLAVFATGAYNYSMASNYNRIPRPPVVMVSGGKDKLILKRESYEDLIRNDL